MAESLTVRGRRYKVTRDAVLAKTRYQRPDQPLSPGSWYVVLRERRVPAKWALRQALGVSGKALQTHQAVAFLKRLGFTVGQVPTDDAATNTTT